MIFNARRIDFSESNIYDYIPTEYVFETRRNQIFCFSVLGCEREDEFPVGIVLFVTSPKSHSILELRYVRIDSEYQGQGFIFDCIKAVLELLGKCGYKKIFIRIPQDMEELFSSVLSRFNFYISDYGADVYYYIKDMKNCVFTNNLDKMNSLTNRVFNYNQIPEESCSAFQTLLNKHGQNIRLKELDKNYTRYFIDSGNVLGYMNIELIRPDFLFLNNALMKSSQKAAFAFPAITASVLKSAFSELPENCQLMLRLDDIVLTETFYKVFNSPNEWVDTITYTKDL